MRRLVIVLADGLRPDAVSPGVMPSLDALAGGFTLALHARTVRPSATVAALASLATGVAPGTHRLIEPGLRFLPQLGAIRPVARELGRGGIPTDVVTGHLGPGALPVAWALASTAGVRRLIAKGSRARETAAAAQRLLFEPTDRLLFLYLPDCDRAGDAYGWMSKPYLEAAAEVDAAIGSLSAWTDEAVFLVLADHGGGGVESTEHDHAHPVNDHIPLVIAGPGVTRRHRLTRPISLLDVSATVLWWFGVPVPDCYEGRPVAEAFVHVTGPAVVPAWWPAARARRAPRPALLSFRPYGRGDRRGRDARDRSSPHRARRPASRRPRSLLPRRAARPPRERRACGGRAGSGRRDRRLGRAALAAGPPYRQCTTSRQWIRFSW